MKHWTDPFLVLSVLAARVGLPGEEVVGFIVPTGGGLGRLLVRFPATHVVEGVGMFVSGFAVSPRRSPTSFT